MSLLGTVPLDEVTPARLWAQLPPAVRQEAATSLYAQAGEGAPARHAAHAAIARTLRFREASVRKLPADKKAGYLAKMTHIDEILAAGLLQALHLDRRVPLLGAFLDALGIAHENGLIQEDDVKPDAEKIGPAAAQLAKQYPAEDVSLYLNTLIAQDPETWGALKDVPEAQTPAPQV